jgi:hypothetical protein
MHMRRVQVQFTDAQVEHLEARAAAAGESVAAVVRAAVDAQREIDERRRRIDAALEVIRASQYRSGVSDVAANHDEYFVQAIEERIGRR